MVAATRPGMVNQGSFGPPYDYCDVQCERCVFERDCVIARELRNARWLDQENVEQSVLTFDRRENDGNVRPPGRQSFIERLRRAGVNYSLSLFELLHKLSAPFTELFKDAEIAAALVAPKVARLTLSLLPGSEPCFDPDFAEDGYRTLLLLEHVDARTTLALSVVCSECIGSAAVFEQARARLWELLAPLSARIPARARAELAQLVVKRRAPSPFFVVSN